MPVDRRRMPRMGVTGRARFMGMPRLRRARPRASAPRARSPRDMSDTAGATTTPRPRSGCRRLPGCPAIRAAPAAALAGRQQVQFVRRAGHTVTPVLPPARASEIPAVLATKRPTAAPRFVGRGRPNLAAADARPAARGSPMASSERGRAGGCARGSGSRRAAHAGNRGVCSCVAPGGRRGLDGPSSEHRIPRLLRTPEAARNPGVGSSWTPSGLARSFVAIPLPDPYRLLHFQGANLHGLLVPQVPPGVGRRVRRR